MQIAGSDGIRARWGIERITARRDEAPVTWYNIASSIRANVRTEGGITLGTVEAKNLSGLVETDRLGRINLPGLVVQGTLSGTVRATELVLNNMLIQTGTPIGRLEMGEHRDGELRIVNGQLDAVVCTGPFTGSLIADTLNRAEFQQGLGGDMTHPASITANQIKQFVVVGNAVANLGPATSLLTVDDLTVSGSWTGNLDVGAFQSVTIQGDLFADPTEAVVTIRAMSPDATIKLGRLVTDPAGFSIIGNPLSRGLAGQIIVNAGSAFPVPGDAWLGGLTVTGGAGAIVLDGSSGAPFYTPTSQDLGGGAIGLAPFHLHDTDCVPANTPATPPSFLNSEFCHITTSPPGTNRELKLRFYGPVRLGDAAHQPLFVQLESASNNSAASMIVDIVQPTDTTLSREVVLHGKPDTLLMPGRYYVRPLKNENNAIIEPVCAGLLTSSLVPVGEDFEYVFDLVSDCNLNGIEDAIDIDNDMTLDVWPHDGYIDGCYHICVTDYNQDGNDDQEDVDCLVALIAGDPSCTNPNANADFNHDGNVDQGDIDALTNAIAGGGCP